MIYIDSSDLYTDSSQFREVSNLDKVINWKMDRIITFIYCRPLNNMY